MKLQSIIQSFILAATLSSDAEAKSHKDAKTYSAPIKKTPLDDTLKEMSFDQYLTSYKIKYLNTFSRAYPEFKETLRPHMHSS